MSDNVKVLKNAKGIVTLEIDTNKPLRVSSTGKTVLLATAAEKVESEGRTVTVNCNVFTKDAKTMASMV